MTFAQGKGASQARAVPPRSPAPVSRNATVTNAFLFRDPDRTMFRDYFATRRITVTQIPPGIAKNLERGKPLPPGIAKRAFPRSVLKRRGVDKDVEFVMVGNNMLAMRNGVVVDIMWNVFP
jgi:hypothetical protein